MCVAPLHPTGNGDFGLPGFKSIWEAKRIVIGSGF